MGTWLGIWAWCSVGTPAFGFAIGQILVQGRPLYWAMYASMLIVAMSLLINLALPDTRGPRSILRLQESDDFHHSGEVTLHRTQRRCRWWGEEVQHGALLLYEMLRQPGFLAIALYTGWVHGQAIFVTMILASLASRTYDQLPLQVGRTILIAATGPFAAILFSTGGYFSRGIHAVGRAILRAGGADSVSIFVWRTISITSLLALMMGYTRASAGPSVSFVWPLILATGIGFLSVIAIVDCHVLIIETFDCSDLVLVPGNHHEVERRRVQYSSHPRVSAGIACCHGFGCLFAAAATTLGVIANERQLNLQMTVGSVAGVFSLLTVTALSVLAPVRRMELQPPLAVASGVGPISETVRCSFFELGHMSRWSEIHAQHRMARLTRISHQGPFMGERGVNAGRFWPAPRGGELRHMDSEHWSIRQASHMTISKVKPMSTAVGSVRTAAQENIGSPLQEENEKG